MCAHNLLVCRAGIASSVFGARIMTHFVGIKQLQLAHAGEAPVDAHRIVLEFCGVVGGEHCKDKSRTYHVSACIYTHRSLCVDSRHKIRTKIACGEGCPDCELVDRNNATASEGIITQGKVYRMYEERGCDVSREAACFRRQTANSSALG